MPHDRKNNNKMQCLILTPIAGRIACPTSNRGTPVVASSLVQSPQMEPAPTTVQYCSECGQPWPQEELARFGDRLICSNCKIAYIQKLREGVASAATFTYAGFWIRFVAVLLDGIILFVAGGVVQLGFAPMLRSGRMDLALMAPTGSSVQTARLPMRRSCAKESPPRQPSLMRASGYDSDRKSTRLNSSHLVISYAVFC